MPPQTTSDTITTEATSIPTSHRLLSLVNVPPEATQLERSTRLATIKLWLAGHPKLMSQLLTRHEFRDKKTGCMPLHWAAGTGFDEVVKLLLNVDIEDEQDAPCDDDVVRDVPLSKLSVDQQAFHPSTSRTPLHYAARNGHLSTCELLISKYKADPHPRCGRGAVTPIQLAVWQNRLSVVRYLVDVNSERGKEVVFERNGFNCGLMHWIGLVPMKRWGCDNNVGATNDKPNDDGSGVLPLARYLHSLGITYESSPENCNTQGHTPNHKAAWGGNLSLIKYFRDEHGVYDTVQDEAGNYSADIAKMRSNMEVHQWLLDQGNGDRAQSYSLLGLELDADMETVKRRYRELAREHHPDKRHAHTDDESFMRFKAAYEHLTKENGIGQQMNPKYSEKKLLEYHRAALNNTDCKDDDLFTSRLIAVISDYGNAGFPVSLISRRWNQIWPERPFPTEYVIEYRAKCKSKDGVTVQKRVNLLKYLKWKCQGSNIQFCNTEKGVVLVDKSKT